MNLMKLLNKDYLFQNLKKSKVVLAIFVGLIPILNTIILIMRLTSSDNYILSFLDISIVNLNGIYIIPIIISICLFNYIYKKKSVDFINSMPISRKSIFITNTFLGILIIILMLFMNALLTLIICLIFNSPIPMMMLLSSFLFYTLVYIFVFITTNLAMTISGNAITQIILTLLLLFLLPFTSFYTNILYNETISSRLVIECLDDSCKPNGYTCHELDDECNGYLNDNKYITYSYENNSKDYTTPFDIIENAYYDDALINRISIIKMFVLTIVYVGLGLYLFVRRKMEVSETSFKNIHIHNIVKSLTLVPLLAFSYSIVRYESLIVVSLAIMLMLIYYFIYDLITKKSISYIRLSLVYFILSIVFIGGLYYLTDQSLDEKDEFVYNDTVIDYNDIKEVAVNLDYIGKNNKYKIYLDNKELINIVVKSLLDNNAYNENNYYISISLKLNDGKEYIDSINVGTSIYNEIVSILESEDEYINYYKNINIDDVYALKLAGNLYYKKDAREYLELIKEKVDNLSLSEFLFLQKKYRNTYRDYNFSLYTYNNYDKEEFSISSYIDYDLLNLVVNLNNESLKDLLSDKLSNSYNIYYKNAYIEKGYNIDTYVINSVKEDIYKFMIDDINNKVDMRDEYFTFNIEIDFKTYTFTTNNIEKIFDILTKKYNEVVNTKEYNNYYNGYGYTKEESIDYYD